MAQCYNCLSDEMTEQEALNIVTEELKKIPISQLSAIALGGFKDLSPISSAVKKSVERICIEGAKKKLTSKEIYLYVGIAIAGLLGLYLMLR